jgi:hypothetical protein
MEFLDTVLYSYILYVKILTCSLFVFILQYTPADGAKRFTRTREPGRAADACPPVTSRRPRRGWTRVAKPGNATTASALPTCVFSGVFSGR